MKIVDFLDGELWWGGEVGRYEKMPISAESEDRFDFEITGKNQTAPLFLSNKGRVIFSKTAIRIHFIKGKIELYDDEITDVLSVGENLKDAYDYAVTNLYKFEKKELNPLYFNAPQYNTWVQMGYMQSQKGVLAYAEGIIKNGYKPGILMIDEGWQVGYGTWRFNHRFPNPKEMVDKLHAMGFKVMLWIVPFISLDSQAFRDLWFKNALCRNIDGAPSIYQWWNGFSASLNLNLECDTKFLLDQLNLLMNEYGIDGFKCDGGNVNTYIVKTVNGVRDIRYPSYKINSAWIDFGADFEFTEYKDTFNKMGRAIPQRIRDAAHSWDSGNGIIKLIPSGLLQNLMGYPYNCPDMIGGGCVDGLDPNKKLTYDAELFVRTAQLAAFFPIMQFSAAPFEVLDEKHALLVKAAADLHVKLSDKIISLVKNSMETGEPIMRHMEYSFPNQGFERVVDQFMLGDDMLVAPVIVKGQTVKSVILPEGKWQDPNGKIFEGNQTIEYPAPIEVVPYFTKIN